VLCAIETPRFHAMQSPRPAITVSRKPGASRRAVARSTAFKVVESGTMRLAELVGTLSLAVDAGTGLPDFHALRGATLAVGFARELGADERTVSDAFYLPLLAMSGCTAESHASSEMLGDEVAIGAESYGSDWGNPGEMFPIMLRLMRRGRSPLGGLWAIARSMSKLSQGPAVGRAHCEVASHLAERFGFDEDFRAALFQAFERWDGTGKPKRIKGEAIAYGMRIALVAIDGNIGHRLGGVDGAIALVRKHSGRGLDPALVERFCTSANKLCTSLDTPSPWATALDAEPQPWREVDDDGTDEGLRAIAHFTDLKCRYTRTHSTGVATLAEAAAKRMGLGADLERTLARAGLVHDVGRVATTAAIWDKAEPLSDTEREKIRLHTYVGERVLSLSPSLAAVAEISSAAHERLDASGYHRRLPATACTTAIRVLAAADVYHALRETRPHRAALDPERAAAELSSMAKRGELCPEAVTAVLGAAGHATRPAQRPHGLTDRELEVLQLLVQGLTNKEIASALDISTKTAGHHVQHVLEKLGVTTRAAATMIAMRAGLAPP
jgi:HD-GYP domain-containing protein (c-di-GMP phosphodiesterase class II)